MDWAPQKYLRRSQRRRTIRLWAKLAAVCGGAAHQRAGTAEQRARSARNGGRSHSGAEAAGESQRMGVMGISWA